MTLDDILQDIYALEDEMRTYERKYGVLSETFYESYIRGEEPADDSWVRDWTAWASAYSVWLRRRAQYQATITAPEGEAYSFSRLVEKTVRRESIPVPPSQACTSRHQASSRASARAGVFTAQPPVPD